MSSPNQTNVHAALAIQLSNPRILSEEEKIFQAALESVQDEKRKNGKLPVIFDNIRHAQNIEDVRLVLELERQANSFWSKDVGRSWLQHLGVFAEYLWHYKVVLDAVVTRSASLGAPIWGTLAFILGFLKDLTATAQDLKTLEENLTQSMTRFKRYFKDGRLLSADLRSALARYYRTVITFVIDMHSEFTHGRTTTFFWAIHRSVKLKLSDLSKIIVVIVYDVDQGALHDRHDFQDEKLDKLNIQLQYANTPPPSSATAVTSGPSTKSITHNLPQPSHAFTGRKQYLGAIWRSLHGTQHCQRRVALYGMGGIGKSQILQKFASDHVKPDATPQPYAITVYIHAHSASSVFSAVSSFMRLHVVRDPLLSNFSEHDYSAFHAWLLQRQNWLLIFDNVREYNHILKAVPHGSSGHVLCSTRHKTVAQQFANGYGSQPLEIKEMDGPDSTNLVLSLVSTSLHEADKDPAVASQVASFAKGIPLVIEQIVHNALLRETSVLRTLQMVNEKTELLRQRNISSLHPENLALGGVVMQAFETLGHVSDKAEALFGVLVYMDPSSIPLSLLRNGSKQFHDYLGRQYTYDRGAIDCTEGNWRIRRDVIETDSGQSTFWEDADPFRPRTWSHAARSSLARRTQAPAALPVDDIEFKSLLRQKCGPATPLGRLFENQVMIDDAITVLCDAAIIRKVGADTLWMHDLICEVAKALIADRSTTLNQTTALAAATTVYLAFPVPSNLVRKQQALCWKYLPHAISCHNILREIGILNDCSIGPELSHLIASTMEAPRFENYDQNDYLLTSEHHNERVIRVIDYYRQAYAGYMAGWQRLRKNHGIDDKRILLSAYVDREREHPWLFGTHRYSAGWERFGRSAPWRAIQTAVKLTRIFDRYSSIGSEQGTLTLEKVFAYIKQAIDFHKLAFGPIHDDTLDHNQSLYYLLGETAGRWQEAHDLCIQIIKDFTGYNSSCESTDLDRLRSRKCKRSGRPLYESTWGGTFASHLAQSCMSLSEAREHANDSNQSQALAKEAADWLMVHLRWVYWTNGGPEYYVAWQPMNRLAEAHERAGDGRAALSWYAGAVVRSMHRERGQHGQWGCSRELIEEGIVGFEGAVERLESTLTARDNELRDLIRDVQAKAQEWRKQRDIEVAKEAAKVEVEEPVDWEAILRFPLQ